MGIQIFFGGAIQCHNCILVNNEVCGIEIKWLKHMVPFSDEQGPLIKDTCIAAYDYDKKLSPDRKGRAGVILSYEQGLQIIGTTFINFDNFNHISHVFEVTEIICISGPDNGGFTYHLEQISFDNCLYKMHYRWLHEAVLVDKDGTFTAGEAHGGVANSKVVPTMATLPAGNCAQASFTSTASLPASVCDSSTEFVRGSINEVYPISLHGKLINVTDIDMGKTTYSKFTDIRIISELGWMFLGIVGRKYSLTFDNGEQFSNISYHGVFSTFEVSDTIYIHNIMKLLSTLIYILKLNSNYSIHSN